MFLDYVLVSLTTKQFLQIEVDLSASHGPISSVCIYYLGFSVVLVNRIIFISL